MERGIVPWAWQAHGRFWWWLHGLGLAQTRAEKAEILRRALRPSDGYAFTRDGAPIDVDAMSGDKVLQLDQESRVRYVLAECCSRRYEFLALV